MMLMDFAKLKGQDAFRVCVWGGGVGVGGVYGCCGGSTLPPPNQIFAHHWPCPPVGGALAVHKFPLGTEEVWKWQRGRRKSPTK